MLLHVSGGARGKIEIRVCKEIFVIHNKQKSDASDEL